MPKAHESILSKRFPALVSHLSSPHRVRPAPGPTAAAAAAAAAVTAAAAQRRHWQSVAMPQRLSDSPTRRRPFGRTLVKQCTTPMDRHMGQHTLLTRP